MLLTRTNSDWGSNMKLVILDSETVSKGDVSLEGITSLCESKVYGWTPNDEVADRIGDADAVICNKCLITEEVFESCGNLKFVGLFATGYNNVDLEAATRHGACVCNVPAYSTESVAQHTFAFILGFFSRISEYAKTVDDGDWINYKLFSYFYMPTSEIAGKTIGIIGYGTIGKRVAQLARAFGMKVLAYTRTPGESSEETQFVSLDELLKMSDVVTLHCPLTDSTKELINAKTLSMMKKTSLLVNTSRGGVINEQDLADALQNEVIAGACLDVLTQEPMREDCPLFRAKNCTITPHIAWAPKQTRERLLTVVEENLRSWLSGKPINQVN